jgi:mRNA interferase RelE/StbE
MVQYRVTIPPHVADVLTHLPPAIKRDAKQALRILSTDPHAGDPLEKELSGLRKYRIRSFRIVYRIVAEQRMIHVMGVAPRGTIYDMIHAIVSHQKT